jgi:hypothetical protein
LWNGKGDMPSTYRECATVFVDFITILAKALVLVHDQVADITAPISECDNVLTTTIFAIDKVLPNLVPFLWKEYVAHSASYTGGKADQSPVDSLGSAGVDILMFEIPLRNAALALSHIGCPPNLFCF